MSNQRFKLTSTAIVAAVNPSVQSERGTVWEPSDRNDVLEAEALERAGYATRTNEDVTTDTYAEREVARLEKQKEAAPISGAKIDAIKQADGTFRNTQGHQVNEDGTPYDPNAGAAATSNNQLAEVLKGTVPDIQEDLDSGSYTPEQLDQLEKLEKSGQKRKGVLDAIAQHRDAE